MEQETTQRQSRRRPIALAAVLVVLVLVCLQLGLRRPWISSLPDVRTEPSRSFVRASGLGPGTAYRLLLAAIDTPREAFPVPSQGADGFGPSVWVGGWPDALSKFVYHPWPKELPPPGDGDASSPTAPWTGEQCEDIERLVGVYDPYILLLDLALDAPDPQMPTADSPTFMLPYLSPARALGRWLAVSACYRAGTGDDLGSIQDLARGLRLGNLVCRGGEQIGHLIGQSIQTALAEAAWTVARQEGMSAAALKRGAQVFLKAEQDAEPVAEALRQGLLVVENGIPAAYRAHNPYLLAGRSASSLSAKERRIWQAVFAAGPLLGSTPRRTARDLHALYQHLIARAEKPPRVAAAMDPVFLRDEIQRRSGQYARLLLTTRDPIGVVLAATVVGDAQAVLANALLRDALLRGTVLFFTVRAFEREHGHLPDTLDQLVPEYLPKVPTDPYSGKPFQYLHANVPGLPPETWAVYSVGPNFADSGGEAYSAGSLRAGRRHNPDLVWPSRPYPLPSEAAEARP